MENHPTLIYHLEELAANAWPARVTQTVGGWRLRYTDGITRRANSVWPNLLAPNQSSPHTQPEIDAQIATVETFYKQRNLPPRFQICPAAQPTDLDKILVQRGYTDDATTNVQSTTINNILEKIAPDPGIQLSCNQQLTDSWFESYAQAETLSRQAIDVRRGILERIAPSTGFASISLPTQSPDAEPTPAALGLGVVERGWLGIFCMTTKPEFRRRGLASSILHGLATWAKEQGATNAYLQVMDNNSAAENLYNRCGFQTIYQYHYREKGKS